MLRGRPPGACPDHSPCEQALAIAEQYDLKLSDEARRLLAVETPKALDNVTTRVTGSVRELCAAAADRCRALGYEPVLLTDQLCCEAREGGGGSGRCVAWGGWRACGAPALGLQRQ